MTDDKNVALFEKYHVLNRSELFSRQEIMLENYVKLINIEALTMLDMATKDILPAVETYIRELAETLGAKKAVMPELPCKTEEKLLRRLATLSTGIYEKIRAVEKALNGAADVVGSMRIRAEYFHDVVFAAMEDLRVVADELETITARKYWPYPTYGDLLFSV